MDTVYIPVGGGGLISGVGAALKHLKPHVKVVAVEPEGVYSCIVIVVAPEYGFLLDFYNF